MDLIKSLDEKFKNIETKLVSKRDQISINHNNNVSRINDDKLFSCYEIGLNECRGEMLKQLIAKRGEHLREVNDFAQNPHPEALEELKNLATSIKSNYSSFSPSLISVLETILARAKLENKLSLSEMIKYSFLTINEKKVTTSHLKALHSIEYISHVAQISSKLLFLSFENKQKQSDIKDFFVATIKLNGDVVHVKQLAYAPIEVKLNETNIILLNKIGRTVEIYDFELEVVHAFVVDQLYTDFKLSGYDIALFNSKDLALTFYNYKTKCLRRSDVNLSKIKGISFSRLFGINDQFIVFATDSARGKIYSVLDRSSLSSLYTYSANSRVFCHMNAGSLYFVEFLGDRVRFFKEMENGFPVNRKEIRVKNVKDFIRFFINNSNVVYAIGNIYLRDIF